MCFLFDFLEIINDYLYIYLFMCKLQISNNSMVSILPFFWISTLSSPAPSQKVRIIAPVSLTVLFMFYFISLFLSNQFNSIQFNSVLFKFILFYFILFHFILSENLRYFFPFNFVCFSFSFLFLSLSIFFVLSKLNSMFD